MSRQIDYYTVAGQVELAERAGWLTYFRGAAWRHGLRASLLLAIASRETLIGRTPLLDDWTGDGGHGRGLMQVDDRYHGEFTSSHANDDHAAHVDYAARFLAGLIEELPSERAAIAAYNAGPGNVRAALRQGLDVDAYTTGGDYSRDVLRREEEVQEKLFRLGYASRSAVPVPGPLAILAPFVDAAVLRPVPVSLGGAGAAALGLTLLSA